MKQTIAPDQTPSPRAGQAPPHGDADQISPSASSVFVSMALDMSWRLALAVLVPIVGGYELDQKFDMTPLLTMVGFLLAMVGMGLVLWRMLQETSQLPVPKRGKQS